MKKFFFTYEDPNGQRGVFLKTTYPITISSPKMGEMYSKNTITRHYYSIDTGTGLKCL